MTVFYSGSGAQGFEILAAAMPPDKWAECKALVIRLLRAQNKPLSANLLESIPFSISEGTNGFGDEFFILHTSASVQRYVELTEMKSNQQVVTAFREIALAFQEIDIYVRFIVAVISTEPIELVEQPTPEVTSEVVERALKDSQQLLYSSGASSAVDRVHTALHGYLRNICEKERIPVEEQEALTSIFKKVRTKHPAFDIDIIGADESKRLIGALATIVDTLNTLRNHASIAHPNDEILEEAEAILVVNCVRTILHYLDAKLK